MTKPTTILLIPHDGDPRHLLGDPSSVAWRCGARPPVLVFDTARGVVVSMIDSGRASTTRRALVLAHDGFRMFAEVERMNNVVGSVVTSAAMGSIMAFGDLSKATELRRACAAIGTIVLLVDGVEVSDV